MAVRAGTVLAAAVRAEPLATLDVRAGDHGWTGVQATLWRRRTLDLTLRSLELAALVTAGSLVLG
ncbi:MAG: hypothetical protein AB7L84_08880, partial [Acidimicrobiia bacterium]